MTWTQGPALLGLLGAATLLLAMTLPAGAQETPRPPVRDLHSDTWVATDALGRSLPGFEECGPPRPNRTIGIFYFLWIGKQHDSGLWDITKLLRASPDDPAYGPRHAFHWWGEPRLGYYQIRDEFVLRKHAQMLTDAGVDVLFLDVTNALTYDEDLQKLCEVYEAIRKTGRTTPQIAFLANTQSAMVVQKLYDNFYAKSRYPDLWFRWKGKPLILTPTDNLSDTIKDFFTIRQSWAWSDPKSWFGDGKDKWPWVDHTPQGYGWHERPDKAEEISVAVAEHPMSNIGRSFHDGKQPPINRQRVSAAVEKGLYFDEQWKRALAVDPELVFITGWNEWIAMRFIGGLDGNSGFLGKPVADGQTFFVDQYNQEFSRDIEPMRGGHDDNYYYQMVAGIRRYKGVRPRPKASAARTIRIAGDFTQWENVGPDFWDDVADTTPRDHAGWGGSGPYRNATGRNDFDRMKVARDTDFLYFYVRTRDPITPPDDTTNWMTLLLDTDGKRETGWEGYDFAVRRAAIGGKTVMALCRSAGGRWAWEPVAEVETKRVGREMHLRIPRAALGLPATKGPLRVDFKWVDNVPGRGDILDFLDQGDAAPNGRFNYRYEE